ncbi:MAG: adenylate/guanylate cyclase domain-containing protein [Chloroflexi bacterium]|nr:adenylate/guanylate cyclase domain-containing protein [Chloroflexota bacterium]
MDAPPIQYARTEDGVDLAYAELGEGAGLPVVTLGGFGSYWWLQSLLPVHLDFLQALSAGRRVVFMEQRGFGLSGGADDDAWAQAPADIAAVADAVGLSEFALLAVYRGVPRAIRAAAELNERVRRLVCWSGFLRTAAHAETLRIAAFEQLADADWETYTDTIATAGVGRGGDARAIRALGDNLRHWDGKTFARALRRGDAQDDAAPYASAVTADTLLAHRRGALAPPLDLVRGLAATLPNASLRLLDGEAMFPWYGDAAEAAQLIRAFLDQHAPDEPPSRAAEGHHGVQTLLFTDLESSTALTQSLGDAKAQEVLDGHDTAVRAALAANGGEEVKHTGDGIFAAFTSAVSAVEAALQIQRELAGAEVRVRVGLNAGEPIAKDDDYFGSAVQLAARVCDRAEPGQVLVSNVVKELCTGKLFPFDDQGETTLKGFPEPVRLFVVGER